MPPAIGPSLEVNAGLSYLCGDGGSSKQSPPHPSPLPKERGGRLRLSPRREAGAGLYAFVEAGFHGGMAWLVEKADIRPDPCYI